VFPNREEALRALPGVGEYTAAAIAAIAFNRRAVVVDGNIERVISRLFAIKELSPEAKPIIKQYADDIWPKARSGDFAQGLMDLGAGICRPKAPICVICPISSQCDAYAQGSAENFPVKAPKKPKPMRCGVVYALRNRKGEILFERRPDKGLLGGMLGLPGSLWAEEMSKTMSHAPAKTNWQRAGEVTHIFTHFQLTLNVNIGKPPKGFRRKPEQLWIAPNLVRLPTVMKKALDLAVNSERDDK